jgi:Protein phosphatase 2C
MSTNVAAAAVTGASHLRLGRNGQDAVASWSDGARGVVVVCDGCGSGARSELGAIYTARALVAALVRQLRGGASAGERATWDAARAEVVAGLRGVLASWRAEREDAEDTAARDAALIEQHLLCTVVAAARCERAAAVWAIGDGAFVLGGELTELGPFADNAPPYLAYDLLDDARPAHFAERALDGGDLVEGHLLVATDGAAALGEALVELARTPRFVEHPDALRRHLATLARAGERIVWSERRVERTAARLQDDAAVGLLRWSAS